MTADEIHRQIIQQRREIFNVISESVRGFDGIRKLAAARIRQHQEQLGRVDPCASAAIGRLQGQIDEANFFLNLESAIQREKMLEDAEISAKEKLSAA